MSLTREGNLCVAQLGYRYQINQFVLGIEGTLAWADIKGTQTGLACTPPGASGCAGLSPTGAGLSYETRINSLATITGQVGMTWDRSLLYVKGGWATGRVNRLASAQVPPIGVTTGDLRQTANGWTVGTGWEYAWTRNISVGLEYDFVRLNSGAVTSTAINQNGTLAFLTNQSGMSLDLHEILLRLNYRFVP